MTPNDTACFSQVTFADRLQYCDRAIAFRFGEFDAQVRAIKRGLATIVPLRMLRLFSWHEVQVRLKEQANTCLQL